MTEINKLLKFILIVIKKYIKMRQNSIIKIIIIIIKKSIFIETKNLYFERLLEIQKILSMKFGQKNVFLYSMHIFCIMRHSW